MNRFHLLAILLATTPLLPGQVGPLIGFAANAAGETDIIRQKLCEKPTIVCKNALPAPVTPWAGGAAFSPIRSSVWHTQGTRIQELPIDSCVPICSMAATRAMGANSLVSGLTINASRRAMYQVETIPGWAAVGTYLFGPASPCPTFRSACRVKLPTPAHLSGAIAFDQRRNIVFVAASVFGGAAPANTIFLLRLGGTNCAPFCKLTVPGCLTSRLSSIRAMAYEECSEVLYISDGRSTSVNRVIWTPGAACPTLRPISCCPLASPIGEMWSGFDVEPIGPKRVGFSCLTPNSCPNCPNMSLETVGTPSVGNPFFSLRIEDAPTGGTGFLVYNVGPCGGLPFLCGRLYPQLVPPPAVIGPNPLVGVGACGGSTSFSLAIPNNFSLCGLKLCTQGIVLCPAGGVGLTNAQALVIN